MIKKLLIVGCLISVGTISAAPQDFSMCEGLSGAEWGICRAGVAAGCADGAGNANACDEIESTYESVSGSLPPWIEPPVECPCDYSLVPKTEDIWIVGTDGLIDFLCGDNSAYVATSGSDGLSLVNVGLDLESVLGCGAAYGGETLVYVSPLTTEQQEACVAAVIDYGQELKALISDVAILFDDRCTPTL